MKDIIKIPTEYSEKLKSILVMILGFAILSILLKSSKPELAQVFLYSAVGVGVVALISSFILGKVVWLWFSIATVMGSILSKIILSIVFYLYLFPIALLSRMSSKNELKLKCPANSAYDERYHTYSKEDLEKIW